MNWTGGRLSRHSRGGAAATVSQRQKAHFAKVQNHLHNGTKKQSPIKWSIFDKFHIRPAVQERKPSLEPPALSREVTQPVAHGKPQSTERGGHSTRDRHRSQSREAQHAQQPTSGPMKQGRSRDDDLYSATPQPLQKRRREELLPENELNEVEDVDVISRKRKKLLEKGDWVGISYQRPLQMVFASPKNAGNVGRRRKVTDGHQVQYANRQSTLPSPFINRAQPSSHQKSETRNLRGQTDVRIHIGDRVVPPGISSSSALSRRSRRPSTQQQKRELSLAASSDVMLLDSEDVLATRSSRVINENPFHDQQTEAFASERYYNSQQSPGHPAQDQRDYETGADEQSEDNEDGGHFGDSSIQYYQNPSSAEVDADSGASASQQSMSPIRGIPFSPTLIRHPKPQSSRVSSILHSGSPAIASSIVAQVGNPKPVVPSSQVLDNEIWQSWMESLYNKRASQRKDGHASDILEQGRTISPGISTAPEHQFSRPASTRYQNDHTEVDREQSEDVDKTSEMVNPSTQGSISNEEYGETRELHRTSRPLGPQELEGQIETGRAGGPTRATQGLRQEAFRTSNTFSSGGPIAESRVNNNSFLSATIRVQDAPISHATSPAGSQMEEDPDNLWRKFVFGSDETNETNESQQLVEAKTPPGFGNHNVIASSLLANSSTADPSAYVERQSHNTPDHSNSAPQPHTPSTVSKADTSSTDIPWDPPKGVASTIHLSIMDDPTTRQSSKLSLHSSHADSVLPSDESGSTLSRYRSTASMAGIAGSQPQASNSTNTPPFPKPPRVLFRKPMRFAGVKAASKTSHVEKESWHIRRGLITDEHAGAKSKEAQDLYNLVDWDDILDD